MAHSLFDLSFADYANEDVKQQLMTAIRYDEVKKVLRILHHEGDTELMEAIMFSVYCQNKYILLEIVKHIPRRRCYRLFRDKFHIQTWKDSLGTESDQKEVDRWELFWIFDTLFYEGEKDFALLLAATYPEKFLTNQKIWPEVIPELSHWCSVNFQRFTGDYMSRFDTLIGEPVLTSLKQWCVETCHADMAFYLAVITKDWELLENMARTQTSHYVHPIFLCRCIEFMSDDRRADSKRGCSIAVAVLKSYPLNDDTVYCLSFFLHGLEQVAKECEDQGLLDWALLLSSDLEYVKRHYKNCQNHLVLNHILKNFVDKKEWEFASELLPRCSDFGTVRHVLYQAFWQDRIDVAKEVMSRVDPSTMTTGRSWTLMSEAVNCRNPYRQDTTRHLVRLCIASGLSTFQRSLNCPWDTCYIFQMDEIPKLRIMKLLVESGTFTHETLYELSSIVQSMLSSDASEEEKKFHRYIQEAAATPCQLQHLARLTISHSIGCQPGRLERIQVLPLPNKLKHYLTFRDVLAADIHIDNKSEVWEEEY